MCHPHLFNVSFPLLPQFPFSSMFSILNFFLQSLLPEGVLPFAPGKKEWEKRPGNAPINTYTIVLAHSVLQQEERSAPYPMTQPQPIPNHAVSSPFAIPGRSPSSPMSIGGRLGLGLPPPSPTSSNSPIIGSSYVYPFS